MTAEHRRRYSAAELEEALRQVPVWDRPIIRHLLRTRPDHGTIRDVWRWQHSRPSLGEQVAVWASRLAAGQPADELRGVAMTNDRVRYLPKATRSRWRKELGLSPGGELSGDQSERLMLEKLARFLRANIRREAKAAGLSDAAARQRASRDTQWIADYQLQLAERNRRAEVRRQNGAEMVPKWCLTSG